jgi:hypothetical protein
MQNAMAQCVASDWRIGTRRDPADLAAAIQGSETAVQGLYLVLRDCVARDNPLVYCLLQPSAEQPSNLLVTLVCNANQHGACQHCFKFPTFVACVRHELLHVILRQPKAHRLRCGIQM